MFIITQDIEVLERTQPLYTMPCFRKSRYSGNIYLSGINLYHGGDLLGTFDSIEDAIEVMRRIESSDDAIVFVEPNPELVRYLLAAIGGVR